MSRAGAPFRACALCESDCAAADLGPLQDPSLRWLFEQIGAAADRRGDPGLTSGALMVKVCEDPAGRAAARGLLGGRDLRPGQRSRLDFEAMTVALAARGGGLTPGAAAAHVLGRRLASVSQARTREAALGQTLQQQLSDRFELLRGGRLRTALQANDAETMWEALRRSGNVARLRAAPDPVALLGRALDVLAALPPAGQVLDRRVLAQTCTADPHALDAGSSLGSLALALLAAAGLAPEGTAARGRSAWELVGVTGDDALGGLLVVGICPVGWQVPAGTLLNLSPRELLRAQWPAPAGPDTSWALVTENPSIASAAADDDERWSRSPNSPAPAPIICTSGTPSAREIAALARLSQAGWQLYVRADFDRAGLGHVRALLGGIPGASTWRMDAASYRQSLSADRREHPALGEIPPDAAPWDPGLAEVMNSRGVAGYEEALLPTLMADRRRGANQLVLAATGAAGAAGT